MKKREVVALIAMVLIIMLSIAGSYFGLKERNTGEAAKVVDSFVQDTGNISVYFCPREDCEGELVRFIDSAQEYIHCAMFEIDLKSVQDKLLEKSKVMEVEVVTDGDYLKEFNHSFVKADSWGLMHNKFCVVDGKKISSGSMNPTNNCAHKNNNNLLLIDSKVLAQNYEAEFEEMWRGVFKKGDKVLNPSVELSGIKIKNYFCPEDDCALRVKEELSKAKSEIKFMTFSFTHTGIANMLLLKQLEGVLVKGVMEARQVTKDSMFQVLKYQEAEVRKDGNKQNMHHKVFVIDDVCVVTGSFNPTAGGDTRNDENVLVICDEKIAGKYLEEFEKVWGEGVSG